MSPEEVGGRGLAGLSGGGNEAADRHLGAVLWALSPLYEPSHAKRLKVRARKQDLRRSAASETPPHCFPTAAALTDGSQIPLKQPPESGPFAFIPSGKFCIGGPKTSFLLFNYAHQVIF